MFRSTNRFVLFWGACAGLALLFVVPKLFEASGRKHRQPVLLNQAVVDDIGNSQRLTPVMQQAQQALMQRVCGQPAVDGYVQYFWHLCSSCSLMVCGKLLPSTINKLSCAASGMLM